nr:hypothetical protein [Candidatus Njordarchaeota archaeon]
MTETIVALHIAIADIVGGIGFLWTLVELFDLKESGIKRIKLMSLVGFTGVILAWIIGGYYYVTYYGSTVKPVILAGSYPLAHEIFMETKEHVFLLIPFLALLQVALTWKYGDALLKDKKARLWLLILTVFIMLLGWAMGASGMIISGASRAF